MSNRAWARCECCGHDDQAHMDEGGEPAPCWDCIVEAERLRERTWGAGPIQRYLHRIFRYHTWYMSRCLQCGVEHP